MAWKEWADGQMSALPDGRIAMLEIARQAPARATLKTLRGLAGEAGATAGGIAEFAAAYAGLREELDEAKDVPEALLGLLDSLSRGPVTLRDVTDDQIALLRGCGPGQRDPVAEDRRMTPSLDRETAGRPAQPPGRPGTPSAVVGHDRGRAVRR